MRIISLFSIAALVFPSKHFNSSSVRDVVGGGGIAKPGIWKLVDVPEVGMKKCEVVEGPGCAVPSGGGLMFALLVQEKIGGGGP